MSFSASPLIPDQRNGDAGDWDSMATAALAAVNEALPQIPAAAPMTAGAPIADPAAATLPEPAGAAVTAFLAGGVEGKILLVVGQELVDALAGTPFGALEPAKALRPALDSIAAALGGRLEGEPTATPPEECLDILAGGDVVIIPLTTVECLTALAPGDVVELDRLAGSPADLLVNGTLLARGEVVVVDESFGLRITEIVTRDAK